jgi:hypothetical protein
MPFALEAEPSLRVSLLALAPQEYVLFLTIHHIVADDWSIGVLLDEFAELYGAYIERRRPRLPELSIQYADYAVWQHEPLHEHLWQADLAYWRERLKRLPANLSLPSNHSRQEPKTYQGGHIRLMIPNASIEKMRTLCEQESASQFMVLLATFQCLLHTTSGAEIVAVGTPAAGRTHPQVAPLIGYFINTVVLCTDLSNNPTFREALGRVRETTLGAQAHEHLPFERLLATLPGDRNQAHPPLFRVWFTLLTHTAARSFHHDVVVQPLYLGSRPSRFDLALILEPHADGIIGHLEYSTDLFTPTTASYLADGFRSLLDLALVDPNTRLSAFVDRMRELEQETRARQAQTREEQRRQSFVTVRRRAQET